MDRLEAIRTFLRVAESGSFSAAARQLGLGQPAVSKQIAALEAHLGARLLRRGPRGLALNELGLAFLDATRHVVEDLEAAEALVGRRQAAPSGLVRLSVAPVFGRMYVTPLLRDFFVLHPEVNIELATSARSSNLVEDGIDLAIRNGPLPDSDLVARPLGRSPTTIVASPAYVLARGEPTSPEDLEGHDCVTFLLAGEPRPWAFAGPAGPTSHLPKGRFRTGDAEQTRAAVLAGLGLAQAPLWLFAEDIASGRVLRQVRGREPPPTPVSLVRPGDRRPPAKVRALSDFLVERLVADRRIWDVAPDRA